MGSLPTILPGPPAPTAGKLPTPPYSPSGIRPPSPDQRNHSTPPGVVPLKQTQEVQVKGIIAWLLGVPLVVIILLYVFNFF